MTLPNASHVADSSLHRYNSMSFDKMPSHDERILAVNHKELLGLLGHVQGHLSIWIHQQCPLLNDAFHQPVPRARWSVCRV